MKLFFHQVKEGFTLIEMVLSVAMLTIILGMSLPSFRIFSIRNDNDVATNAIVQNLRRAQVLAQVADGDSNWGLHLGTSSILIFKGAAYASRDSTYDDVVFVPSGITVEGLQDVVFTKVTGMPQMTGSITLTSQTNEVRTISINQKGMVDY